MQFLFPEGLLLIPGALLLGAVISGLQLFKPLRLLIVCLVSLWIAEPMIGYGKEGLRLTVLLDRSASTEDFIDKELSGWLSILEESRPGAADELEVVNYAAEVTDSAITGNSYTGSRQLTRTGLALSHVLARQDTDKHQRFLLFTDGFATEPIDDAIAKMKAQSVPLDYRLVQPLERQDARLTKLKIPERVEVAEPFLIRVEASANTDGPIHFQLTRDGRTIVNSSIQIKDGRGFLEFSDRLIQPQMTRYQGYIFPETDALTGNNTISKEVQVIGGDQLLFVTRYKDDPMAAALSDLSFSVRTVTEPSKLSASMLSGVKSVIINNVSAHEIPTEFLKSLNFFVKEQAGGLLMVGGKRSFGAGGYFESAIDPLLPVSMELKAEHRKLSVALAIVMDRSGSMSATVAGGKTKMDLANAGAASAIKLLGNMDHATVFAVDSEPTRVVPLSNVGAKRNKMIKQVSRIRSAGGGIFVYVGLEAAWDELENSPAGTRHIILFTDVDDTEEPGNYQELLKEMTDDGVTVSVIGLGTKAGIDAKLCEDIAKLGNGRIFFSNQPMDLPKIFAQETVTIARSAFLDEPVKTAASGSWAEISPQPITWLSQVDGYNLSYARPDATVSLVSDDDYLAPLVAHARRGLGRTMAISFPLGGEHSSSTRSWSGYGDFVQTVGRFLMGEKLPAGISLNHRLEGTTLTIDLLYDEEIWSDIFAEFPPTLRLNKGSDHETWELGWERIEAGRFRAKKDFDEGTVVRGAVTVGQSALAFGPITIGSNLEWVFDAQALTELRAASKLTGGRELANLSEAWEKPLVTQESSLALPIGIIALICILLEALITRTGWKLPVVEFGKIKLKNIRPQSKVKVKPSIKTIVEDRDSKESDPVTSDVIEPSKRKSRYARAKNRR